MPKTEAEFEILVAGGGGRELEIAKKLMESPKVARVFIAPGNAGVATLDNVEIAMLDGKPIKADDINGLMQFAVKHKIEMTVVGPEGPLCDGIVDVFMDAGMMIFGPCEAAAQLEGSKVFAKECMMKYGIPTAPFKVFSCLTKALKHVWQHCNDNPGVPIVIKADGLCGGKGVKVCNTLEEAESFLRQLMEEKIFGEAGTTVVIEDCLAGQELSIMTFWDGRNLKMMLPSQDHKPVGEGDTGPNTGGMGAFARVPWVTDDMLAGIEKDIFLPLLEGLRDDKDEKIDYRGVLYAGLMYVDGKFYVLEFNVRFGDPETQAVLPLLESDLFDLMLACPNGLLDRHELKWKDGFAVCVVAAAEGYPGKPKTGFPISGIAEAETIDGVSVTHAGTVMKDGVPHTASGRVLGVTGVLPTLQDAIKIAYQGMDLIDFEGKFSRPDIGKKGLTVTV